MSELSSQSNFLKIQTVNSGYFTYIIGRFKQPGVYVLGAMDLNDPTSWSGGESAVVFYFLITPEEYGWLVSDRPRLDDLAQRIQTNMPKSRFFSAICSKKSVTPQELKQLCDDSLKEEALEDDGVFAQWKQTVALPRRVVVPKTPLNQARHELALFQKGYKPKTATPEQQEQSDALEKALGWLLFKADALYVALDQCYNPSFPFAEPAFGNAVIFSDATLAQQTADHYARNHAAHVTIQKLEQAEIKSFLRRCEELGIRQFRLDDGLEPVTIRLEHIIPELNRGFIENFNAQVRFMMLRAMQPLHLLRKHGEEMERSRNVELNNWFMTWNRRMLQDLGKTTLFVACGQVPQQLKQQHLYSQEALDNIKTLMETNRNLGSSISRPGFPGRDLGLKLPQGAMFPTRLLKTPDGRQWVITFTGRERGEAFVKAGKSQDVLIGLTMDQLAQMVDRTPDCNGILLDPGLFGLSMSRELMDKAMTLRTEKRVVYRAESQTKPAAKKQEELFEVRTENPLLSDAPRDEQTAIPEEAPPAAESTQQAPEDPPEEKGGFFGRLFGRK